MRVRRTITVVLISIIWGCDSGGSAPELTSIPFTEVVISNENLITDSPKRLTVVRSLEQFQIEWSRISSAPLPANDFQEYYVVIAEKGYQSSGHGYIAVGEVLSGKEFTEVHVTTFVPGDSCDLIAALSSPYHVVAISNRKPVIFKESREYLSCN